ncbi:MAG TPA: RNA polymerase sigma factor [Candidatus Krumholzibacteria bacterium]|nr:RNA polymerase sigma factor [Candidatus Krumholzibacteria bacterium]
MTDAEHRARPDDLAASVALAKEGDRAALARVVRAVQPDVYRLALRFLWHPQDAEDATQEILIRVFTRLSTFRGDSSFRTWVYRVASNALLTIKKSRAEHRVMNFESFAEDLDRGLSDRTYTPPENVEKALVLEEIKVGCTLAMLLCLDRPHRLAYILGEILELDHREAASILEIQPATFRKRLSRARARITGLMQAKCGLFDRNNACRCHRRAETAIQLGRVDPHHLLFASAAEQARRFPSVLEKIRELEGARRAAALYRSNQTPEARGEFTDVVLKLLK